MRCLTVTCNTAVDTTYVLGHLEVGAINRVDRVLPTPGGKGNNVARVLSVLGHEVTTTGFAGGYTGAFVTAALAGLGITPAFVDVAGDTRVCLTIVEDSGRITEVREPGTAVNAAAAERLLAQVTELARTVDVVALSGSLPPGLPSDYYADLVRAAKAGGAFVALDSSGDALRQGLGGVPDLVKPNADELAGLLGISPAEVTLDVARRAHRHLGLGHDAAMLLSLGPDGAGLVTCDGVSRATPPPVTVANTVGAGDALLAGFLHGRTVDYDNALRWAVAAGTAAAMEQAVGVVVYDDIVRMLGEVTTVPVPEMAAA